MPPQGPDQDWVARSRNGDREAYEQLVVRHYRCVYALCLGMLANTEEAQDLTQETMLVGFEKIRNLRQDDRFGHWILQIARNLCIDAIRRRKLFARSLSLFGPQERNSPQPRTDVAAAIGKLPMELRIPIVMFYLDGREAAAIAERLQISKSSLYQRMRDARARLYELLREDQ